MNKKLIYIGLDVDDTQYHIGFTLQRDLADKKYHCDVVAPSSIPRKGGKAIKTDRIDAAQLAQFYANDLLTLVQVPEYVDIANRCLRRLSKKGNRLLLAGKHPNKVKVACAREMVGFVWESLRLATA